MFDGLVQVAMTLAACVGLAVLCLTACILALGVWLLKNVVDELKKRDGTTLVVSNAALLDPGQHNMVHPGTTACETSADQSRSSSPLPDTSSSSPSAITTASEKSPTPREPPLTTNTPCKSESVTAASATPNESTPSSASKDNVVQRTPAEYLQQLRCLFEQISEMRVAIETVPADMLDDAARESYSEQLKEEERQVCQIQERLSQLEELKDGVTLQASQEMASRMRAQLDLVLHEWSKLSDIHTVRQKQWRKQK